MYPWGLTLVKQLVELHGGRVEAQSDGLGQGSLFTFHLPPLPQVSPDALTSQEGITDQTAKPRLLVIDDNPDAAMTLSTILKLKGYEVHTLNSGQAGLESAESLCPMAILLDISMPDMDGYQTCQAIRQQSLGQSIIVMAVTSYGQKEDQQRTQTAGFDGHLVKPVDVAVFLRLITDLLHQGKETSESDQLTA